MIPSELAWFTDVCCRFSQAPQVARLLGSDLIKQFSSKDARKQVNRVFKRHEHAIIEISNWLDGNEFVTALKKTSSELTLATHKSAGEAIKKIVSGETASIAWNMRAQRGRDVGFSATMEAAALAGYLSKIWLHDALPREIYAQEEDLAEEFLLVAYIYNKRKYEKTHLFNSTEATAISAELFGIHPDNIRKYSGHETGNAQSEASIALFGLCSRGLLRDAERYFDVEELIIASVGGAL